jgi:ubiquinone/menaquinone biosynthesis C-methylase UbiE
METSVERLYRRHAPFYDATRRYLLPGRRRAIDALGVRRGDRVLDFACGTGLNVPHLDRAGAGDVVGIDLSEAMLVRARRKHPRAQFLRADMRDVDLGAAASRVICTYGLSLLPDPVPALQNLHRHVAPGGRLVILDFGRPPGALGTALAAWLSAFGVRAPTGPESALGGLFERLTRTPIWGGVAVLFVAEGPLPGNRH